MRTIPSGIRSALDSGSVKFARIMKATATNGTVYAWTDHDNELVVTGTTYKPAPGLSALRYISTPDASVSTQSVQAAIVEVPDEDLRAGILDEAEIEAAWCLWDNQSAGKVVVFVGKVGNIKWTQDGMQVEFVSSMKDLERVMGETFTAGCRHELFGTAKAGKVGFCGVNPASYTFTGTVGSITTAKWKFAYTGPAAAQPDGYFNNGVITFTSGLNAGLSVPIKSNAGDVFELFLRSFAIIAPGDTFSVKAGCDKTLETCKTKFNNVANFGGFPHINAEVTVR